MMVFTVHLPVCEAQQFISQTKLRVENVFQYFQNLST